MPALLLALGCAGDPAGRASWPPLDGPPTDTVPVFQGRVPRDLVFVSIDTLRKDHLGRWSDGPSLTPRLDARMKEGFVLEDHRTCSDWTFPAVGCTLAGFEDWEHGQVASLPGAEPWWVGRLLAEHLADAGFTTTLASANGWLEPRYALSRGYQTVSGTAFDPGWPLYTDARDRLIASIDAGEVDRFFFHLHLIEPHAPYDPPPELLPDDLPEVPWDLSTKDEHYEADDAWPTLPPEEQAELELVLRARYDAEVRHTDELVDDVLSDLEARGLLDDALVVVWTDHGEQFWEHGHQSHAWTLNAEENDGVVFFAAPNLVPGAWDGPTLSTDLAPTLLALFGLPPDVGHTGIVLGQAPDDRARYALSVARSGVVQSVSRREWKLTWRWDGGETRLYDRAADPREAVDLFAPDHPAVVELWPLLEKQAEVVDGIVDQQPVRPAGL